MDASELGRFAGPAVTLILGLAKLLPRRSPRKRLYERSSELASILQALPKGSRAPLEEELSAYVSDLRSEYHYWRVRRLDGSNIAAVVLVAIVAGTAVWGGLSIGHWWSITPAVLVAIFCALLLLVGWRQNYVVPVDDTISPPRARRENPKQPST